MKIQVSKITMKIGKVKHELSLDEAKELQRLLNDVLGNAGDTTYFYLPNPVTSSTSIQPPCTWTIMSGDYTVTTKKE